MTWALSFSGDRWLNLDRIDGIDIVEQGDLFLVVAERSGLPNTILGQYASKNAARVHVRELIGDNSALSG